MAYRIGTYPSDHPRVAGLYAHLLDRERRRCAGPDPRVHLSPGNTAERAAALTVTERRSPRLDKLEAGEPVVVAGWEVGGGRALRQQVPWLDGNVTVKVHADDTIELAGDDEWDSIG
jgi:hypothetical protein